MKDNKEKLEPTKKLKSPTVDDLLKDRPKIDTSRPSESSYLTMVLLTMLLPFGVARVYIGSPDGKIRVSLFLGALGFAALVVVLNLLLSIINVESEVAYSAINIPLTVVAIPLLIASLIRGVIDFATVLKQRTDYGGRELRTTEREDKWARVIFYSVISALLLVVVLLVLNQFYQVVYFYRNGLFLD